MNKIPTNLKRTLSISIVVSLLLSNQAMANNLPNGGKFVGGNGSIHYGDKNVDVIGKGGNGKYTIAWGGGFNIGKDHFVNFGGSGNSYLNLDYSKNPSKIAGTLKGNGNDVFIVNPSGVIITESGKVEVGNKRFGISTTPMSNENIKAFQNSGSFSPVFKANSTRGDIINKGSINAGNVKLVGNRVILEKTFNDKKEFNQINANNINIEGKDISIDVASINGNTLNSLSAKASNKAKAYLDATGYYYNTSSWNVFDKTSGINLDKREYVTIGSDVDWWYFAKGTNTNSDFRNTAKEYRLTSDIDFQGNKGIGEVGKDWQNYADYCIEGLGCTSMIVGNDYDSAFTVNFDGQGYTLKNINIDFKASSYIPVFVGIFGSIKGGEFKNINVDYMGGGIKANGFNLVNSGGFAGSIEGGTFSNITLNNIGSISGNGSVGGFMAGGDGNFLNITLNNIGSISSNNHNDYFYVGGFVGLIDKYHNSVFSNITLNNIGSINSNSNNIGYVGGFFGSITYDNCNSATLQNIYIYFKEGATITTKGKYSSAGKFFGNIYDSVLVDNFSNIHIYYNGSQEALDNPNSIANATNDEEKPFYNNGITLHPYTDEQDGFSNFYNDVTNFFKEENDNPQIYKKTDSKGNTYFTFLDETNNGNGGDNGSNGDNGLSDVVLTQDDFPLINQILGDLEFNLLAIKDENDIRAIKQSLEFLLAFVGKDGLEQLGIFKEFALVDDNELANITQTKINNLYNALNDNLENIKKINNFNTKLEAYMGNYNAYLSGLEEWLKPELEKAYKELMALKGDMEEAYKDLQKDVGNIFFINQDYKALANNNNVRFNLASLKAIPLIPNVDKDDNQRITSPLKDINASMLDKQQVVLIKPAEEEKETLDEEKGVLNQRTCVVSENFKTNNPCMAQRI